MYKKKSEGASLNGPDAADKINKSISYNLSGSTLSLLVEE